ncbi:MAG TPA: hypothetical protein VMK31_02515 [Sphingomicrobium sp.]|nr:hypothetical protein [Sphingomicrobium sp.]
MLALCACGQEQTFDQRYSKSQDEIEERARELDNELDEPTPTDGTDNQSAAKPI